MLLSNPWIILGLLAASLVLCLYARHKYRQWRDARLILKQLGGEEFFHCLYVGSSVRVISIDGRDAWFDSGYTVVLKHNGRPALLIGFTLSRRALRVHQMQGLPGFNFQGAPIAPLLLSHAETIALKLGKSVVWVQAAERNIYYTRLSLERKGLYEKQREHQKRMVVMYNATPLARGYVRDMHNQNFLRGHYKVLREEETN